MKIAYGVDRNGVRRLQRGGNGEASKRIRKLQRHGNSIALIFDEAMIEALGITPETPLHVTIQGDSLTITPARSGISDDGLAATMTRLRPHYKGMLENLAE